jgi:hypothetical protein
LALSEKSGEIREIREIRAEIRDTRNPANPGTPNPGTRKIRGKSGDTILVILNISDVPPFPIPFSLPSNDVVVSKPTDLITTI